VKIAVLQAYLWIGEPLSKAELTRLFDDPHYFYLSLVAYHVDGLADVGLLEKVRTRSLRSGTETYYFFPFRV
jgi:hypothetical protein